jgi:hypothetical protein
VAAAFRARTLAAIARARSASPSPVPDTEGRRVLLRIADLLDNAAQSFETEEPETIDEAAITSTVPSGARLALAAAEGAAAEMPAIGFPPRFGQYVTTPVYGNDIDLPPSLRPASMALAAQEDDLIARLRTVHAHLETSTVEEVTAALLKAAFTLHFKRSTRLADAVRVDNARPRNQVAAASVGDAPAEELPWDESDNSPQGVTAPIDLTAYTIGIIQLAQDKGLRPAWSGVYRGARRITLNAGGPHGTFGTIHVGKTSGKVLRAEIIHGNGGTPRRAKGTNAVRALLATITPHTCPENCTASAASCRP